MRCESAKCDRRATRFMFCSSPSNVRNDNLIALCQGCYDRSFGIWKNDPNTNSSGYEEVSEAEYLVANVMEDEVP